MVFFNYATMQMAAKIVYYGPGLCGKTTNLQHIYQKTSPKSRGEMVSLETETDRTLFFDLLPLDVGNIAGFKTRFQLYTVPGQVFYNSTRKLVLRGVDGVVFVADSQVPMMEANLESWGNLRTNLQELGLNIDEIPLVFQYNKRDLKNITPVDEMNRVLNPKDLPHFEGSAVQGTGVFETLKGISKATLITLRRRALGEDKLRMPEVATRPMPEKSRLQTPPPAVSRPTTPPVFPSASVTPQPAQTSVPAETEHTGAVENAPAGATFATGSEAVQGPPQPATPPPLPAMSAQPEPAKPVIPTASELAKEVVEFAQVSTVLTKPAVKKIAVKTSDIGSKLDALRELYTGKAIEKLKKQTGVGIDPLSALLESTKNKERKVTKKLKIKLEPAELEAVKNLSLDFHLIGGNVHKRFSNALTVSVEGKSNPKRVSLRIELEILKK